MKSYAKAAAAGAVSLALSFLSGCCCDHFNGCSTCSSGACPTCAPAPVYGAPIQEGAPIYEGAPVYGEGATYGEPAYTAPAEGTPIYTPAPGSQTFQEGSGGR